MSEDPYYFVTKASSPDRMDVVRRVFIGTIEDVIDVGCSGLPAPETTHLISVVDGVG